MYLHRKNVRENNVLYVEKEYNGVKLRKGFFRRNIMKTFLIVMFSEL